MKEHGQMLNMTGFERPMMKTLCLAFFLIFVFYRSILSTSTVHTYIFTIKHTYIP